MYLIVLDIIVLGGVVVSAVTSQQEGPGFESIIWPFCVEFECSLCVCVGSLQVLQLPPKAQRHAVCTVKLAGDSKST